jgi:hypothetical protein
VRAVIFILLCKSGGSGQKAGMPAHDNADINAGNCAVVKIDAGKSRGHKFGGRAVTRAVVGNPQVIVDSFGNMYTSEFIAGGSRIVVDYANGVGRIVAAVVKEITHVMLHADLENLFAIVCVRLVAGREQR